MNLIVRYFERGASQPEIVLVNNDVLEVRVPVQGERPPLCVTVNTDAVLLDTADGKRIGGINFDDLYAEAKSSGDWE